MSYVDDTTLIEHIAERDIIQLCDDEKSAINELTLAGAIVANSKIRQRIDNAVLNAESQINALSRKHWEVPIRIDAGDPSEPSNTPPLIVLLCAQLTIVKLFQRRAGDFTDIPDSIKDIRKEAADMLKMINHGDVDLGINPAVQRSPMVVATAVASTEERLFTQETLKDF